ncbi:MAG: EAL domain-containing protein [Massilia sp.]
MVKHLSTLLSCLVVLTLVALPVALSVHIAERQSVAFHTRKAQALADEVVRRTDETGSQVMAAVQALTPYAREAACSPEEMALMRKLQIGASYLQGVGRMRGDRLVCSSHGAHGPGYELGPADFVSDRGTSVRISAVLPLAPQTQFIILEVQGYAAVVHPALMFDVPDYDSDITLGVLGNRNSLPIAVRGGANLRQLHFPALAPGGGATMHGETGIAAQRRSRHFDLSAVAVIAPRAVHATANQLLTWLLPLGLGCGLLLAWGFQFFLRRQVSIPALLRAALRRHEFFVVYQPIVRLDNRRCVGAEALLRWRRQDGKLVGPDLFIPIAEATGLIGNVTARMLELVGADLPAMVAQSPAVRVSVNLAPQDLSDRAIVERLRRAVSGPGVAARNLTVEATERGLIDVKLATSAIRDLQDAGFKVAIDDFGTGYSCLSYLDNLKVNCLKIDKSFIDSVGTAAPTNSVVGHIIEMAKSLGVLMVAEGVESEAQAEFLRQRGVQFAQGWLFARPMPAAEFLRYLAAQSGHPVTPCVPKNIEENAENRAAAA